MDPCSAVVAWPLALLGNLRWGSPDHAALTVVRERLRYQAFFREGAFAFGKLGIDPMIFISILFLLRNRQGSCELLLGLRRIRLQRIEKWKCGHILPVQLSGLLASVVAS